MAAAGAGSAVGAEEGEGEEEAAATGRPGSVRSVRTQTTTSVQSAIVVVYRAQGAHSPSPLRRCLVPMYVRITCTQWTHGVVHFCAHDHLHY